MIPKCDVCGRFTTNSERYAANQLGNPADGPALERLCDDCDKPKPYRVQLSRKAGWRMPPNTVKVSRPGRFGNPFAAKIPHGEEGLATMTREYLVADFREWLTTPISEWPDRPAFACGDTARTHLMGVPFAGRPSVEEIQTKLRGHNLACWCPLSQPCHADVLLEIANAAVPALSNSPKDVNA